MITNTISKRISKRIQSHLRPQSRHNWTDAIFQPNEEQKQLRSILRKFVQNEVEPQALSHNRIETFNLPLFQKLATELDLLGITIPAEYGGVGLDPHTISTNVALVHEELSYSDPAFCLSYLAHSILFVNNLYMNGNEEQRLKYLPNACSGNQICGMGMSEASGGTDVLGMKTNAKYDKGNDTYILNGSKMWITNGTIDGKTTGDLFLVYAKTGEQKKDITQFIIEKDMPGFILGQKINDKCGMRASPTAEIVFQDVVIPSGNVVGEVNNATLCMMRNLEIERLALASMSIGIARRCIDEMIQYSTERHAFSQPLHNFGQIQAYISTSYSKYMAGKSYLYSLANYGMKDLSTYGNGLDSDGIKLYCSKMAKEVADDAIQVMGGYGYVGEYVVERLWRDAKLLEIGGGTNESHHKNMVRDLRRLDGFRVV